MAQITQIRQSRGVILISAGYSGTLRVTKKHFQQKPLAEGDEVDLTEYIDSVAALQFHDAYEAALTLLDFSERSSVSLAKALIARGFVPPAASAAVEKLKDASLVDDERYAKRLAESAAGKSVGRYAMRSKLIRKGIPEEEAERALECLTDEQQLASAKEAAEKISRRYEKVPPREARNKISQALARRGFSWDTIASALEGLFEED